MPETHLSPFVSDGGELPVSNTGQRDMLRAVVDRGLPFRTTVRGYSMAPFIRDGDIVTLAPLCETRGPHVGDVVAFILPSGTLAIHRIVARAEAGWLLRGDNTRAADGTVRSERILGRVVRIERNRREIRLGLVYGSSWVATLSRIGATGPPIAVWQSLRRAAALGLSRLQGIRQYRAAARRLSASVQVVRSREAYGAALHECRDLEHDSDNRERPVIDWVARWGSQSVGSVQFVREHSSDNPWSGFWLSSLAVPRLYRGMGIGERLARTVVEEARAEGAREIFLVVFEDSLAAISLYRKLGFRRTLMDDLEPHFVHDHRILGRKRVTMRKQLDGDD